MTIILRKIVFIFLLFGLDVSSITASIVLDFETNGPRLSVLESSISEVSKINGVPYSKMATPGDYEVRINNDIVFSLEADKVDLDLELKQPDLISNIRFKTRRLKLEEAQALANEIHAILELETQELDKWFNGIREDSEFKNYTSANVEHYPAIGLMLIRTLYQPEPVRLQVLFDWDIISTSCRGTSVESNKLSGLRFDYGAILGKVKIEQEKVAEPTVVQQPEEIEKIKGPNEGQLEPELANQVEEEDVFWWPYVLILGAFGIVVGYWMFRRR